MNLLDDLSAWLGFGKSRLRVLMARWIAAKVRVAYAKPSIERKTWDELRAADVKAGEDVAQHVASTMAVADLLGRRRTIIEAEDATGRTMRRLPVPVTTIAGKPKPVAPAVVIPDLPGAPPSADARALEVRLPGDLVVKGSFKEAVDDLITRNPKLAAGYREVQAQYAKGHVFALAKSTDATLTRRVQQLAAKAIREGAPTPSVTKAIAELGDWTENYAETVYHTNAATAYSGGRMAQSRDPDIAAVMPAFELLGRTVPPSRPNHAAAVGLVAGRDDPIWSSFMPPLGYNCTHVVRLVDRVELRRRGLLREDGSVIRYEPPGFAEAYPDPGFGVGSISARYAFAR